MTSCVATQQQVAPRELAGESDVSPRLREIPKLVARRLDDRRRLRDATSGVEGERIADEGGHDRSTIRARPCQLERPCRVPDRFFDQPGAEPGVAGGCVELLLLCWIAGHLERLLQEPRRLHEGAERSGAFRGAPKCHASLCGDRFALWTVRLGLVRRHVVLRQCASDPFVIEGLEVPRGGDVQAPPIAPCERPVGHLPDEALDEPVLALVGRPRVGIEGQHLAPDERPQSRGHVVRRQTADGREGIRC